MEGKSDPLQLAIITVDFNEKLSQCKSVKHYSLSIDALRIIPSFRRNRAFSLFKLIKSISLIVMVVGSCSMGLGFAIVISVVASECTVIVVGACSD